MPVTPSIDFINQALPVAALSLWVAIYVLYFWRDPDIRRWLERETFRLSHRRPRYSAPRMAPILLERPVPERRPLPKPRPPARAGGSAPAALARIDPWQATNLPLRYRLLGQVRPASNDN